MCIYDKCFCAHNSLICLLHGLFEGRFECRPVMAAKLANSLIDDRLGTMFLQLLTKLFMLHIMLHFVQSLLQLIFHTPGFYRNALAAVLGVLCREVLEIWMQV